MGSSDACGSAFSCLPSFVAGILFVVVVEIVLARYLLRRLVFTSSRSPVYPDLKVQSYEEDHSISLQGHAWVAPIPEDLDLNKVFVKQIGKDKKDNQKDGAKRDALEIAPVRRHAILDHKVLLLRASDGTKEEVSLEGCEVLTISGSPGESRKWGKKFPIKVHHPNRLLYRGRKTFLFYAQSGYAKEAWCEAFRAMAGTSKPLSKWIFEMKKEYREYTHAAEENMPYLTRFYASGDEAIEPNQKESEAAGPSKRRMVWRKLARKASMGRDHKETRFAHAVDEVHRRKHPRNDHDLIAATPVVDPNFDRSTSFTNGEADSDQARVEPKEGIEQGVLCLNMIVARLYYDFNRSERRLASVERWFQGLLMKIRKPSYIKSISIKELDLGRHPPFARAMRILPPDAGGALAMEIDLEWHGGGHLTCETRLDLREQATQGEVAATLAESGSEGDDTAAVLSGLRGKFDEVAGSGRFPAAVQEGRQAAENSNKKGRWMQSVKSMMSRVADQISQVPIVLKIRLVSLKGTVVLKLKAPPSDRVWFAFKTMPDIQFEHEPCIGEHRFSSDALARVISNAIKVQIRDSVVMPFCEDIFLNWMLADKENWLPTSKFPFSFFDSQSAEASKQSNELHSSSSDESSRSGHGHNKPPKAQVKSQKQKQAQEQQPSSDGLRPRRSYSGLLSGLKPVRSASADQLNAQASVPKPPRSSSRVRLSTLESAPVRALLPMLSSKSSLADEPAQQLDMVRSAMESRSKDFSLQSEGSVSDSDVQFLANQVANPGDVKEVADDSKLMKRRARVKKRLGEVRHLKHHKRQDDGSA